MDGDFNFNIVILIGFLIVGGIRWLIANIFNNNKPAEREHWEEDDYDEQGYQAQQKPSSLEDLYEEARREILNRQNRNIPEPEVIQEKLRDYRNPQPRQTPPTAPPPIPGKARVNKAPTPPKAAEAPKPFALPEVRRPNLSAAEQQAIVNFQEISSHKGEKKRKRPESKIRDLLASPSAARDAIVLTEILGQPKGMR